MVTTIRNPLVWTADQLKVSFRYAEDAGDRLGGGDAAALPAIRRLSIADLRDALRLGWSDMLACRTFIALAVLVYPAVGILITAMAFDSGLVPLIFPAAAGFALLGPVAAVGLYELSRRRERGESTNWFDAFAVFGSPAFAAIVALGLILAAIFVAWLVAAKGVYDVTLGPAPPESAGAFLADALSTGAGWGMILLGCGIGALFAALVLSISVVSFPLLLDRNVGVPAAVVTSIRVTAANPRTVGSWGLIVALTLALASIPLFLGLILVMPVLGHATWHLYRRAVAPGTRDEPAQAASTR